MLKKLTDIIEGCNFIDSGINAWCYKQKIQTS